MNFCSYSIDRKKFSERLKLLRASAGLTREQLAADIGVSPYTVASWEIEKSLPNLDAACRASRRLGCTTDQLAGLEPINIRLEAVTDA